MKKLKIFIGLLAMIIVSCQDARDIDPVDLIGSEQAFGAVSDFQQSLNSSYLQFFPENVIQISSRFVDDLRIGSQSGGQGIADLSQVLNPSSGSTTNIWNGRYSVIGEVNTFLAAAATFETSDAAEQAELNAIIAQGLALRALSHIDLMALYSSAADGNPSAVFAPGSLSVPYITEVDVFAEPARNTVAEVAALATADLDQAAALLGNPTDKTLVTQEFITAARSRLAFYTGDFTAAISFADDLIAQFPLANPTQYFDMFRDLDLTEVIWTLPRNQADPGGFLPGGLFYFTNSRGPFLEVSFGLGELIQPGDARGPVIIDEVTSEPGETRVGKYFGRPGENGRNNILVFRVSEQFLIKAESQARLGDLAGAAATLNILVDARFGADQPTPIYANLTEAIGDILTQRRLELVYEGQRYIDVRRTQDFFPGITRNPLDCGAQGIPCSIPGGDGRFALPIPNVEVSANPNIVQNPGFGS